MGSEYLWLLKTDANGTKLWDRTFGGFVSSSGDGAWSVDETDDGGYIVTGYTRSFGDGSKDLWLIRTDEQGKEKWDKTFGGSKDDVGMYVVQTKDKGYIVTGRTASYGSGKDDIWVIKTNKDGRELWNHTFGGSKDDIGLQVLEVRDGYVITGRTESEGTGKKAFLLKVNPFGKKLWEKTYTLESAALSMQNTTDDGFILAGHIESKESGRDAWFMKTDPTGLGQWSMRLGGAAQDIATSVVESDNQSYVFAGITDSYGDGVEEAWLVKFKLENITSDSTSYTGDLGGTGNSTVDKVIVPSTKISSKYRLPIRPNDILN
jgi:hypothetical protein